MGIELFFIAVGLSMDAFAVSVCKGLSTQGNCRKASLVTGAWFGGFQALMPLLGYLCGEGISRYITAVSKYVALIVLSLIGINMIREAIKEQEECADASLSPKIMLPAAIATSIDAFAVGITLAALQVHIVPAVLLIGCTTFFISFAGVHVGNVFGKHELSVMESIGMTKKQCRYMLQMEGFWYAIISLALCLTVGNVLLFLAFQAFKGIVEYATFSYPIWMMAGLIIVLIAFCWFIPLLFINHMMKKTTVERLRQN